VERVWARGDSVVEGEYVSGALSVRANSVGAVERHAAALADSAQAGRVR
jgi:hypothetical protein